MIDHDYEIMVTDVTNVQFARYLNQALAAGELKSGPGGRNDPGYYPGDEFHGYNHELEIIPGDYLHVALSDPGCVATMDDGATSNPSTAMRTTRSCW